MIYTDMTKKAINIMFEAHKNQKDKSNTPYVFHPWSIAEKMTNEIEGVISTRKEINQPHSSQIDLT